MMMLIIGSDNENLAKRFSQALNSGYKKEEIEFEINDNIVLKHSFTKEEFVDNYYPSLDRVYGIIDYDYDNMINKNMIKKILNIEDDEDNYKISRCFENIINSLDDDAILSFYSFNY